MREAVHEGDEARGDEQRSGDVELRTRAGARDGRNKDEGADEGNGRDGHVDVEVPTPGEGLGEDSAEEEADRSAGAGDRAEDAEGTGAFLRDGEGGREDGEGGRSEERPEDALKGAGGDEQLERGSSTAECGSDGEADEADDEGALATHEVGEATAEEQEAPEGERVGGDDLLALTVREAEVCLRGGQGDVHDGRIKDDHQLGEADDDQRQPAATVGRGC